jgi:hypothetical protein
MWPKGKPAITFKDQVEYANSRGVGQFHIFKNGQYERSSWRSFEVAKAVANKHGARVVNDSGDYVA